MHARSSTLLLAAAMALVGCAQIYDELGLSPEDQEQFEEFIEGLSEAASEAGGDGTDGAGSDGAGSDGAGSDSDGSDDEARPPPTDPDWSPSGVPPPPAEPYRSSDQSDHPNCPTGWTCGRADYEPADDPAIRDHYEDLFDRPPDSEEQGTGFSEERVTSGWDDGDVRVEVVTDKYATSVEVYSDTTLE